MTEQLVHSSFEQVLRELGPEVLGALVRRFHAFADAEDAVQEALLDATLQWPKEGLPTNPRGWLIQVATRRLTDHFRTEFARRRREQGVVKDVVFEMSSEHDSEEQDDTLTLLFMCCHPALTEASSIALTLRAVGGLTTAQIARAFLVPEATMAQRISRAKQKIKDSGTPFRVPTAEERHKQLGTLLHTLYLIFNEGYATSDGPRLWRDELSQEAIRLTRAVLHSVPDHPEATGLLSLMLLTDARRRARTGVNGELIPLMQQDRTLWDRGEIAEGIALISAALPLGAVGPYQLQAAIAAIHDEATGPENTDWLQILVLYDLLRQMTDNPMVMLNHAIASAMVHGPRNGLQLLDALEQKGRLGDHHRLAAARAHLLEMAGDYASAVINYRIAATRTASLPERYYLLTQAARLTEANPAPFSPV